MIVVPIVGHMTFRPHFFPFLSTVKILEHWLPILLYLPSDLCF
jgi:hypothetical protein